MSRLKVGKHVVLDADTSPLPCTNFYDYACSTEGFLEDSLSFLRRDNRKRTEQLIKGIDGQNDVSRMYDECEAYNALASKGHRQPSITITSLLTRLQFVRNYDDLAYMWGQLQLYDAVTPLDFLMLVNPWQADTDLPTFEQSGLFANPEQLSDDAHRQAVAQRLAILYSNDEAEEWSETIVQMEQTLFSIFTDGDDDDALATESLLQYLEKRGKSDLIYDWQAMLSDVRFNITKYLVGCKPSMTMTDREWMDWLAVYPLWCRAQRYLASLPSVIVKYTLQSWIAYTQHSILMLYDVPQYAAVVTPSLFTIDTLRYQSVAQGKLDCVRLVGEWMTSDVVDLYVDKYVSNEVFTAVRSLADSVQATFGWMLEHQALLKEKMWSVSVHIGDERPPMVNRTRVFTGVFIDDFLQLRKERISERLLGVREDMTLPVHVEARYRHQANALDVSVGLLREPLFVVNQTRVQAFARLGTIIGHELAHSIDGIGVNFDEYGNYNPMQTTSDDVRTCIRASGYRTRNEDFADVVGVHVAYTSFGEDSPEFFTDFAQMFCTQSMTPLQEQEFVRRSTHSTPAFRVNNVVESVFAFKTLYNCPLDSDDDAYACINLF